MFKHGLLIMVFFVSFLFGTTYSSDMTLTQNTTISDNLIVDNAVLDLNSYTLTVDGNFTVQNNARLKIKNKADIAEQTVHSASITYNGFVYVLGGYSGGTHLNTIQKYNLSTKTWTKLSVTLPEIRASYGSYAVYHDKL